MKTRVTFRVADDLAEALRELPNQTHFVETALRDALGLTCPACGGQGRIPSTTSLLPNFKEAALPPLDRGTAIQLRALVRLARQVAATRVDLSDEGQVAGLGFTLRREGAVLLAGKLSSESTQIQLH